MKFYEINSGDIKIDGVSTSELTRENIHDLFTMVLQDTWMFEGTVRDNIIYNRKDISNEKVVEVCKTVGLHHFIISFFTQYATVSYMIKAHDPKAENITIYLRFSSKSSMIN